MNGSVCSVSDQHLMDQCHYIQLCSTRNNRKYDLLAYLIFCLKQDAFEDKPWPKQCSQKYTTAHISNNCWQYCFCWNSHRAYYVFIVWGLLIIVFNTCNKQLWISFAYQLMDTKRSSVLFAKHSWWCWASLNRIVWLKGCGTTRGVERLNFWVWCRVFCFSEWLFVNESSFDPLCLLV